MSERLTKVMNDPAYGGCGGVILAKCENCTTRLSSCYEDDCGKQVEANKKLAIIENMLYDADGNEVISLARLRELAKAESEGRVVVLKELFTTPRGDHGFIYYNEHNLLMGQFYPTEAEAREKLAALAEQKEDADGN